MSLDRTGSEDARPRPDHSRPVTIGSLAEVIGARTAGDARTSVGAVRSLDLAGPGDLSFVTRADYRPAAEASSAGALLVPPALADLDRPLLIHDAPKLALAQVLDVLYPRRKAAVGVHRTAVVDEKAEVEPSASIGAFAVIEAGARVGAGAEIHAHVVIGRDCRIGEDAVLHPHVVAYPGTEVGARTVIHAGTVLGADGFGYAHTAKGHVKLTHVGRTEIGDDVEIGALSAVDRALTEATRVDDGTKIDNLVQVGHNVVIGRHAILCGQVGIAGTATLGDFVVMGGQSGAGDHVHLGRGAQVAARAAVLQSIGDGDIVGGVPAADLKQWRRQVAALKRVPEWARRIRRLEKKLAASEDPDG